MGKYCDVVSLAGNGKWTDVYNCLAIDQDATVDLSELKVPLFEDTTYIHNDIKTMNALEIILALILLTDQFFLIALIFYCALLSVTYFRLLILTLYYKLQRNIKTRIIKSLCGDFKL